MVTRSSQSHTSRYRTICRCHPPPNRLQYRLYPKNVKMLNLPNIDVNNFTFKISVGNVISETFFIFRSSRMQRCYSKQVCYQKFCNIHRKTSLESLHFNLMPKETSSKKIPVKNKMRNFYNKAFFVEHLCSGGCCFCQVDK